MIRFADGCGGRLRRWASQGGAMGRHTFDPFEPRVTVFEAVVGFVCAAGVGVAGSFTSDPTVSRAFIIALFGASLVVWVLAIGWLAAARKRLATVSAGHTVSQGRFAADSTIWPYLTGAATATVLGLTITTFALGVRADPDYRSPYDGQDPNAAGCVDAAVVPAVGADGPVLRDLGGRKVGHVELRASPKCGTIWAKVYFDESVAPSLKGQLVTLVMVRPADGARTTYPLRLQGGTEGFSNMLSAADSCVKAQVYFTGDHTQGPISVTPCVLERA